MPDLALTPQQVDALRQVIDSILAGDSNGGPHVETVIGLAGNRDYYCTFEGCRHVMMAGKINHTPICPVLIARDLKAQME